MIPRLAPRRSRRPLSSEVTGIENTSPFLPSSSTASSSGKPQTYGEAMMEMEEISASSSSYTHAHADLPSSTTMSMTMKTRAAEVALDRHVVFPVTAQQQQQQQQPPERRQEVLSNNQATLNNPPASPSPSPSPSLVEPSARLETFKSPLSSSDGAVLSDWSSNSNSNNSNIIDYCSLTPPVTGPRPLMVSAKRFGSDVRRKHSKRRRCRSRRKSVSAATATVDGTAAANIGDNIHDGAYCLWKDANAPPSQESSSSEEEDHGLPFLFSQRDRLPPQKQAQQYWEYCYGKTSTTSTATTTATTTTTTIKVDAPLSAGWSANRKPPSKGCLSHTKLPRPPNHAVVANKFKTPPPTPEDEEEEAAKNNAGFTPSNNSNNNHHHNKKGKNRVQFGSPKAAEYEVDGHTAQLTPLPPEVTRQRYSMDPKQAPAEEEEMTVETKRNSALLAEWEEELQPASSAARRRQQRKNRRSSSIFTPSPMSSSLLLDDSDDEENESSEQPLQQQQQPQVPSPSTMVMENLASLCVDSPTVAGGATATPKVDASSIPPTLTPLSSAGSDSSSSDTSSFRRSGETSNNKTAEFAISLESVNASGGAMDTTPPRIEITVNHRPVKNPSTIIPTSSSNGILPSTSTETTPPPTNMNLDAIHSVGGALDHTSPPMTSTMMTSMTYNVSAFHRGHHHSPISRMSDSRSSSSTRSTESSSTCEDDEYNAMRGITTSARTSNNNIVEMLLKDPSADQAWEAKNVFQNLAEKQQPTQYSSHRIMNMIASIQPRLDGVLSCFEDLKEQARFCASTKSNTKFQLPASEAPLARKLAIREWNDLEIEFVVELSEALERNVERAVQLLEKAESVLNQPIEVRHQPALGSNSTPKSRRKKLEREIALLKKQIHQQQESQRMQEALEAPYAALQCQGTAHIGVCGFRLDEYTGACLQLSYEHPIAGVESQFCVDLTAAGTTSTCWKACYVSDAFISSSPHLLPATHAATKFHQHLAKRCFEDPTEGGLLHQLQDLELPEAILLLSRWLGLLDVAMMELVDISTSYPITFEWPVVNLSLPSEEPSSSASTYGILKLTYECCNIDHIPEKYVIAQVRPTRAVLLCPGRDDQELSMPFCSNNGSDLLKQLLARATLL